MDFKLFVLCVILPALCTANPFPQPTGTPCPPDGDGYQETLSSSGGAGAAIVDGNKTTTGGGEGNINTGDTQMGSKGGSAAAIDDQGNKTTESGGTGDVKTGNEKLTGSGGSQTGLSADGDKTANAGGDSSIKEKNPDGTPSSSGQPPSGQQPSTSVQIQFVKATCPLFTDIEVVKTDEFYFEKVGLEPRVQKSKRSIRNLIT